MIKSVNAGSRFVVVAMLIGTLSACGGDGDEDAAAPVAQFELPSSDPAAHVGRLVTAPESIASLVLQPPDGISAVPYCVLRLIGLRHSNGSTYLMNVAFEAAGKRVVVVTLANGETSWLVSAFNPPLGEASVDPRARRLTLQMLRSTQGMQVGWEATISGQAAIPTAAAGSEACH